MSSSATQGVFPSPKKMDTPAAKTTVHTEIPNQVLSFNSSSQKSNSQSTAVPSSPQKSSTPSTSSVPQSPLKSHVLSRGLNYTSSPQKPELCAKPAIVGPSASQKPSTPAGPSEYFFYFSVTVFAPVGHIKWLGGPHLTQGAGLLSLTRMLYCVPTRCQVITGTFCREMPGAHQPVFSSRGQHEDSHCDLGGHTKHQTGSGETQSSPRGKHVHRWSHSKTEDGVLQIPNISHRHFCGCHFVSNIFQDKDNESLLHFQERESELAKIRSCFQNGNNMWKNRNEATDTKKNLDVKVSWLACAYVAERRNNFIFLVCVIYDFFFRKRLISQWRRKLHQLRNRMRPQPCPVKTLMKPQRHPMRK